MHIVVPVVNRLGAFLSVDPAVHFTDRPISHTCIDVKLDKPGSSPISEYGCAFDHSSTSATHLGHLDFVRMIVRLFACTLADTKDWIKDCCNGWIIMSGCHHGNGFDRRWIKDCCNG